MRVRLITAGIGIALLAVVLFFMETLLFDVAVCAVALIGVHELLDAYQVTRQSRVVTAVAMCMGVLPFLTRAEPLFGTNSGLELMLSRTVDLGCCVGTMLLLLCFLWRHETLTFTQIAVAFFAATAIPNAMATLVLLRNQYGSVQGTYLMLVILSCAWGADSGAYFAGRFFGKRKLAPKVSPKKTVEGLYGGLVAAVLLTAVITLVWAFLVTPGEPLPTSCWLLIPLCLPATLAGVLGDLTASAVKRQCGIKDFGVIMPGHGGMLDRFDSVLFTAPFLLSVLALFPY